MHRYVTSDQFSPDCLLDCLDLSSEHQALEIANRVEASTYIWRRRRVARPVSNRNGIATTKSSWSAAVKDMVVDAGKRELFADRAETILLCLKQRFPGLTQTALDVCKIQFNKVCVPCNYSPPFNSDLRSIDISCGWIFRTSGNPFLKAIPEFWRALHSTLLLASMNCCT